MLELPAHFFKDLRLAHLAHAYYWACVLLLAVVLQTDHKQQIRTAAGIVITTALLVGQPFIYHSSTQTYGIGMASSCCLGAWTLLHWTFIEQKKPSVLQVCISTIRHPFTGVIKVHARRQRHQAQGLSAAPHAKPLAEHNSSGRPLVIVDAVGDMHGPSTTWAAPSHAVMLFKSLATVLLVCCAYDVGLYFLCALSNGMCSPAGSSTMQTNPIVSTTGMGSWMLWPAQQLLHNKFLEICLFAYMAGSLLPLQMEVMYCCLRSGLLMGGLFWPALGDFAEQLPSYAFNRPAAAKSISELWGYRWHQFLRFYFEGLGYTTVDRMLPKGKAVSPGLRSSLHSVVAFVMSGVMHEYLTWAAFGRVTGYYMAFFGLHCAAVLLEGWGPVILKALMQYRQHTPSTVYNRTSQDATDTSAGSPKHGTSNAAAKSSSKLLVPTWAKRIWAVTVMLLLSPLFVEPCRAAGYFHERAWHPFGMPVTPQVVSWVEQHLHAQLDFAEFVSTP